MAYISVSYVFYNSTIARQVIKSAELNQNFDDLLNGLTDGTKDIKLYDFAPLNLTVTSAIIYSTTTLETLKVTCDTTISNAITSNSATVIGTKTLNSTPAIIETDSTEEITLSQTNTYIKAGEYNDGDTNEIVVDANNRYLEVTENGESTAEVVTLDLLGAPGYTGATMAAEIESKMNSTLTQTYTCTYSGGSYGTYTISCALPFTLWVTGGKYITKSVLKCLGFKLGGTAGTNTTATSFTSDVAYKIGYYNVDTINAAGENDGEIYQLRLQPYSDSGSYAPVVVSVYESDPVFTTPDVALTKNSVMLLQAVKSAVTGSAGVRVLAFSANFNETNY